MADVKISQLTALASASTDVAGDVLAIVDTSVPQTKKITVENLLSPITLDKSNARIGIGTASPDNLLHIKTTGSTPSIELEQDAGTSYKALFKLAGNDLEIRGSSGAMEFYNGGNNDGDSATLALTLDSSQNATFAGDINLAATKGLFLDGASGHTFIKEFSANKMQLQAGGQGSVILDGTNSGEIRMGVGTSSPRNTIHSTGIVEISNASSNSDTERIRFGRTDDSARYSSIFHKLSDSAGNNFITFKMHNGSSQIDALKISGDGNGVVTVGGDLSVANGDIQLANGRGLSFANMPNESSMTSELLDDYEEGTWSPQVWDNHSGGTQLGAGTAVGRYVKIGQLVHIQGYWICDGLNGASGATWLRNIPFVSHSTNNLYGSISIGYSANFNITANTSVSAYLDHNGSAAIGLVQYDTTQGISALQASEISAYGAIIFGGTYITN